MKLSENEKRSILALIKIITDKSLDSNDPSGLCFSTSMALCLFLKIHNVSTSIQAGTYNNFDHFWLSLDEYQDVIIDTTLKQFDNNQLDVYIGKKDDNNITREYQLKTYDLFEWLNIYTLWQEPILDETYQIHRKKDFIEKVVITTLTQAAIIHYEMGLMTEKSDLLKTTPFAFYFSTIYQGLREKWSKNDTIIKILQNKLPGRFDVFLNGALK